MTEYFPSEKSYIIKTAAGRARLDNLLLDFTLSIDEVGKALNFSNRKFFSSYILKNLHENPMDRRVRLLIDKYRNDPNMDSTILRPYIGKTLPPLFDMDYIDELLLDRQITINDISKKLGYSAHMSFTNAFVKKTGQTPDERRKDLSLVMIEILLADSTLKLNDMSKIMGVSKETVGQFIKNTYGALAKDFRKKPIEDWGIVSSRDIYISQATKKFMGKLITDTKISLGKLDPADIKDRPVTKIFDMDHVDGLLLDLEVNIDDIPQRLNYQNDLVDDLGHSLSFRRDALLLMVIDDLILNHDVLMENMAIEACVETQDMHRVLDRLTGQTLEKRIRFLQMRQSSTIACKVNISHNVAEMMRLEARDNKSNLLDRSIKGGIKESKFGESLDEFLDRLDEKIDRETIRQYKINQFAREVIEASNISIRQDAKIDNLLYFIRQAPEHVMHRTGLEPDAFFNVVVENFNKGRVLVPKFHSAQIASNSNEVVQQIIEITRQCLSDDIKMSNSLIWDKILDKININRQAAGQMFLEEVGVKHRAFIKQIRVEEALKKLAKTKNVITHSDCKKLSATVGLGTELTLSEAFESLTGLSPIDMQKQIKSKTIELLEEYSDKYHEHGNKGLILEDEDIILEETCLDIESFLVLLENYIDHGLEGEEGDISEYEFQ